MTPEVWGVVIAGAGLFVTVMGGLFTFVVKISNGVGRLTEHVEGLNDRMGKVEERQDTFDDRQYQAGVERRAATT
tara:strand:+ start:348 stop:572 length:225 start_codon:yes stop_codon:yes gene_type:complete